MGKRVIGAAFVKDRTTGRLERPPLERALSLAMLAEHARLAETRAIARELSAIRRVLVSIDRRLKAAGA
jgi:hypothetical protein